MGRKIIFFCLLVIHPILLHGQSGYYFVDSTMFVGVELMDNGRAGNARICQVKEKKQLKTYTPDEVNEYGFKDGEVYVAKVISLNKTEKKVFLERLSQGTFTLYYYRNREGHSFFLELDSGRLLEVPRKDSMDKAKGFREIIGPYLEDCEFMSDQLEYLSYKRMSFRRFANRYNECKRRPFPHIQFGITAGYGFSQISTPESNLIMRQIDFKYDGSPSFGVFIDIPVLVSDFSIHAEVNCNRNYYTYDRRTEKSDVGLQVKTSSLNIPVMMRYAYPFFNYRPYVNAGGIYSYYMICKSQGFHAVINDNSIETSKLDEDLIHFKHQVGLTAGCGIQINLASKHSLFVELRYLKTFNMNTQESLQANSFSLSTSINF